MRNLQNPRTKVVAAANRAISPRSLTMAALLLLGAVALSPIAHADAKQDFAVQQGVSAVKAGDFTFALAKLQPPAKAKNPRAAYWLGRMYEYGLGVKKNVNTAVNWYRTSADAGWAMAKLHLGEIYLEGTEELQNFAKAHKWLEKAADDGNARAQRDLGKLYANGWGVKKDPVWAYVWYELAAEHGDFEAQRLRDHLLKTMSADQITEAQRLTQTVAPEAFGPTTGTNSNKPAGHSGQHQPNKNGSAAKPTSQSGAQSGA